MYESEGHWRYKCQTPSCGVGGDYYDIKARIMGKPVDEILREEALEDGVGALAGRMGVGVAPTTQKRSWPTLEAMAGSLKGVEDTYRYINPETGKIDMVVFRLMDGGKKTFRQGHQNGVGFLMEAPAKPWPILNRGMVKKADRVIYVEGEKVVKTLHKFGFTATTSPGGAGKATHADLSPLAGKTVYLWPDNDPTDPQTGKCTGVDHMKEVAEILNQLNPRPSVYWIVPDALGLNEKGDAHDYLLEYMNEDGSARDLEGGRLSIEHVLIDATPMGGAAGLWKNLEDTMNGLRYAAPWPWREVGRLTQALLPGTVTILCGDPGVSKTWWILQSMLYWHGNGLNPAIHALEEDKEYYLNRFLALAAKNFKLIDLEWIKANPDKVREEMRAHRALIDDLAGNIWVCPKGATQVTQDYLVKWVEERAKAGSRVIAIDPVTAVDQGKEVWKEDMKFLLEVKQVMCDYKCSAVMVTHPRGGQKGEFNLDGLAGGRAWARYPQTVFWLKAAEEGKEVSIMTPFGCEALLEPNRLAVICKSRNGPGNGKTVGFEFSPLTAEHTELGVVKKERR